MTSSGSFLVRSGVTPSLPEGRKWVEESPPAGVEPACIVVGDGGVVWMIDSQSTIRFRPGLSAAHPQVLVVVRKVKLDLQSVGSMI